MSASSRSGTLSGIADAPDRASTAARNRRPPGRPLVASRALVRPEFVESHELTAERGVDVGVEHDRAQHAGEVEERACHRRARDAVDLVAVLVVDGEALVDDETVVAGTPPALAHDLDRRRSCLTAASRAARLNECEASALGPAAQHAASTSPRQVVGAPPMR